jgi:shikimate dehydrogenase
MKIALIGGKDINKYTIAPIVWNEIGKELGIKIDYQVLSIRNKDQLQDFIHDFQEDESFLAFNVALPWKRTVKRLIENKTNRIMHNEVNTVYKSSKNIRIANTDIPGLLLAINRRLPKIHNKRILIIGYGGVGYPLTKELIATNPETVVFDIKDVSSPFNVVNKKDSLKEKLKSGRLDIIINCSPVGKSYLQQKDNNYSIPINFSLLKDIVDTNTLVVECNYYKLETPLLKLSKLLGARTIRGVEMLVNQAIIAMSLTIDREFEDKLYSNILNKVLKNDVFES